MVGVGWGAGAQVLKGSHRPRQGAADSPTEGGGRKGDPRVGTASELERSHGDWSSGSSAPVLGCNFLHHPKSSQRTVPHHHLEGQTGKGRAHRETARRQVGWRGGVGDGDQTTPEDWEAGLRGDPGKLCRGPHSVWVLAGREHKSHDLDVIKQ